jgi:hypothetical protein
LSGAPVGGLNTDDTGASGCIAPIPPEDENYEDITDYLEVLPRAISGILVPRAVDCYVSDVSYRPSALLCPAKSLRFVSFSKCTLCWTFMSRVGTEKKIGFLKEKGL